MDHNNNGAKQPTLDLTMQQIVDYMNSLPPGWKFHPEDDELIVDYLVPKINGFVLPINLMHDVNIYKHNPDYLAVEYSQQGNKGWYFFTPRDKKYKNGKRPSRQAGDGYWKATGADKVIMRQGVEVGYRKALVFYKGRPPKGEKTLWIMHEFRVTGPSQTKKRKHSSVDGEDTSMRLDDFILCRIYKKNEAQPRAQTVLEDEVEEEEEDEDDDDEGHKTEQEETFEVSGKEKLSSPMSDPSIGNGCHGVNMHNSAAVVCGDNIHVYNTTNDNSGLNDNMENTSYGNNGGENVKVHNTNNHNDVYNPNMYHPSYASYGHNVKSHDTNSYNYRRYDDYSIADQSNQYDMDVNPSTAFTGLVRCDQYLSHGRYNFSDFLYGDNDHLNEIAFLLLDPPNPTMEDPIGIMTPLDDTYLSTYPNQVDETNVVEVKDVQPPTLPPAPHSPHGSC